MTKLASISLALALSTQLSGCSFFTSFDEFEPEGDGGVDTSVPDMHVDAGPQANTANEFFLELSSRLCGLAQRCEAKVPGLRVIGGGYCLPTPLLTSILPDELSGDGTYSPGDGRAILASLDDASDTCSLDVFFANLSFIGLFRGTLAIGEGCNDDQQCGSGYCTASAFLDCGMCARLPGLGDTCAESTDCPPGSLCDSSGTLTCVAAPSASQPCLAGACDAGAFCQTGTCIARPMLNQACTRPSSSPENDPCASTLVCTRVTETPEAWRCESGVAVGLTCEDSVRPCAAGLRCVEGTCQQPVAENVPCAGDVCALGLVCRVGTCQPPPTIGQQGCSTDVRCLVGACSGGSCVTPSANSGGTACGLETAQPFSMAPPTYCSGSHCNMGTGMCVPYLVNSATCVSSAECAPASYCASSGMCAPRLVQSASCAAEPYGCTSDLRCIADICSPPSADGGDCGSEDDCLEGLVCVAGTCTDCRP